MIMFFDDIEPAPVVEDWSCLGAPDPVAAEKREWVVFAVVGSAVIMLFDKVSGDSGLVVDASPEELARAAVAKPGREPWPFPERVLIPPPDAGY